MTAAETLARRKSELDAMLRDRMPSGAELTELEPFRRMFLKERLSRFDDATLRQVSIGKTSVLPLDLPVDATTRALASEILKERTAPTE